MIIHRRWQRVFGGFTKEQCATHGTKIDGYQWVLFVAAHSERHTKQMLEAKAGPNFPKS